MISSIVCPDCKKRAERVGAQDGCDVYVCAEKHVTRVRLNWPREEWKDELADGNNQPAPRTGES